MPIIASDSNNSSTGGDPSMRAEPGYANAVCYAVWDIGWHESTFKDEKKTKREVIIGWEIDQIINNPESDYNGKRKVVSRRYTLSLGDKSNLTKDLTSWFGSKLTKEKRKAGIDLESLIGMPAMINLVQNGEWVNVGNVMPKMPNQPAMTPEIPPTPPAWVQELQKTSLHPIPGLEEAPSGSYNPGGEAPPSQDDVPPPDEDYAAIAEQEAQNQGYDPSNELPF